MKKLLVFILVLAMALSCFTACGNSSDKKDPEGTKAPVVDYGKINVGVQGNMGSSAAFCAEQEGYWADEHIKANITVTTGPQLITGLQTGTLDVAFLGNGVSWSYFAENGGIKMLAIDNLTDDDRLIAKASTGISEHASLAEIETALKGSKVALDLAATPGSFFKSLVSTMNEGKEAKDMLWFKDLDDTYPNEKGLAKANEIFVVNTTNANIYAAMSSANSADFCVAFSPISTQLLTDGFVEVAKTSTHLADKVTPSNWAVSTAFLEENPEAVQAFVNALVSGMDFRAKNIDKACDHTFDYLKQDVDYAQGGVAYWPTKADLADWLANGDMAQYATQIRDSHVGTANLPDPAKALTIDDACDFSFLENAVK